MKTWLVLASSDVERRFVGKGRAWTNGGSGCVMRLRTPVGYGREGWRSVGRILRRRDMARTIGACE